MNKREQFAVSLRKEKTRVIVQQKRRKILQSFQNSKGKTAQSSIGGNSQEDMQTDENENSDQSFLRVYNGHPQLKHDSPYKAQLFQGLMGRYDTKKCQLIQQSTFVHDQVLLLLQMLQDLSQTKISQMEQLVILVEIRQRLSSQEIPNIKVILETNPKSSKNIISIIIEILT